MLVEQADESFPPGTDLRPSTGLKKPSSVEYTLALSLEDTDGDDWGKSVFDNTPEFRDFLFQRDVPRQSIEDQSPEPSSYQSIPSTPSSTTRVTSHESESTRDDISDTENGLRDLKLDSEAADQSSRPKTPTLSTPLFSPELPDNKPQVAENLDATPNRLRSDSYLATPGPHRQASNLSPSPSARRGRRSMTPNEKAVHRVEDEELPKTVFHSATVQQTLSDARSCISRIAHVLSSTDLHRRSGSALESLHQQASELADWELPSSCIVGLVGDSGTGKSSLINSLLDNPNLAKTSSNGFGCTSVVTEFVYHDRDNYVIHVDYFSIDEIDLQLQDLLMTYRDGTAPRKDSEDADIEKPSQQKVDAARAILEPIFQNRFENWKDELCASKLEGTMKAARKCALRLLPKSPDPEPCDTVEQCASRLAELTSEVHNTSSDTAVAIPWFFVRSVKVYLKAHILSQGLILADLPGLRDVNPVRARATERYIRQCHHMLAVVEMNRAATNQSVMDVFQLAKDAHLGKIDIVCTKAEDVKPQEAGRDKSTRRKEMRELIKKCRLIERNISSHKAVVGEIMKSIIKDSLDKEELQKLQEAAMAQSKAESDLEATKFKLQSLLMEHRNEKVSSALQTQYKTEMPGLVFQIFCISNTLYGENRSQPVDIATPWLKLSGILQLRKYCIGIAAGSRLASAKKLVNQEFPVLLGSIELWLTAADDDATAEQKQTSQETIFEIEKVLKKFTTSNAPVNMIARDIEAKFYQDIYCTLQTNGDSWRMSAKSASYDWDGFWPSSYLAWCRNDGIHETRKVGYRNWNEEAMAHMKRDMDPIWCKFIKDLEHPLYLLHRDTYGLMGRMCGLARSLATDVSAMQSVDATLGDRLKLIHQDMEDEEHNFSRKIVEIRDSNLGVFRTGLVAACMEKTYHEGKTIRGRGSDRKRKVLIPERFGSEALFEDIRKACLASFQEAAQSFQEAVHKMIRKHVGLMEKDLEVLKSENAVTEDGPSPEFREQVKIETRSVREKHLIIL